MVVEMKAALRSINDHGIRYQALMFVCPGCASMHGNSGLHMLPVNSSTKFPSWDWDGNLEAPTLSPSILTGRDQPLKCHSFLKGGIFEFLGDSTHALAGQNVPIPDLPSWAEEMNSDGATG